MLKPWMGARCCAQIRAWATRAWIFPDRRRRRGSEQRRAGPPRLAGGRLSRQHALHGCARPEARAPGRAGAGHGARDHGAHGLPAARHARGLAGDRVAAPRRRAAGDACRSMPAAATITRCLRARLQSLATRIGRCGRPVRPPRLHRLGAAARGRTRRAQRHRLARQAHAGAAPRGGLDVLPRRDLRRSRAAAHRAGRRALRPLQRLHRRLPDAGDRRALPARRAALHLLPDDRARRADPARAAPADRQPHLRLRRLPARLPVEQVRAAQRAARLRCARAARRRDAARAVGVERGRRSCATPKAARSAASATSAGSATWPCALATRLRAAPSDEIERALHERLPDASPLVGEHIEWALRQRAV